MAKSTPAPLAGKLPAPAPTAAPAVKPEPEATAAVFHSPSYIQPPIASFLMRGTSDKSADPDGVRNLCAELLTPAQSKEFRAQRWHEFPPDPLFAVDRPDGPVKLSDFHVTWDGPQDLDSTKVYLASHPFLLDPNGTGRSAVYDQVDWPDSWRQEAVWGQLVKNGRYPGQRREERGTRQEAFVCLREAPVPLRLLPKSSGLLVPVSFVKVRPGHPVSLQYTGEGNPGDKDGRVEIAIDSEAISFRWCEINQPYTPLLLRVWLTQFQILQEKLSRLAPGYVIVVGTRAIPYVARMYVATEKSVRVLSLGLNNQVVQIKD